MNKLLICYDLFAPGQKWAQLDDLIPKLGTAFKIRRTTWFLSTTWTYEQVSDRLNRLVDDNDKLVVMELTGLGQVTGYSDQELAQMNRLLTAA